MAADRWRWPAHRRRCCHLAIAQPGRSSHGKPVPRAVEVRSEIHGSLARGEAKIPAGVPHAVSDAATAQSAAQRLERAPSSDRHRTTDPSASTTKRRSAVKRIMFGVNHFGSQILSGRRRPGDPADQSSSSVRGAADSRGKGRTPAARTSMSAPNPLSSADHLCGCARRTQSTVAVRPPPAVSDRHRRLVVPLKTWCCRSSIPSRAEPPTGFTYAKPAMIRRRRPRRSTVLVPLRAHVTTVCWINANTGGNGCGLTSAMPISGAAS